MVIEDPLGNKHRCTAKRKFDYAVCGDWIKWELRSHNHHLITEVSPRRNEIARVDKRHRRKVIAANIDQMVVVTASEPTLSRSMIDRYLVAAAQQNLIAIIVLNKIDLLTRTSEARRCLHEYSELNYSRVETSVILGQGIDELRRCLNNKTSIFVGQSGVGKSALLDTLHPGTSIRIAEESSVGQHTTTAATLYHLPDGGDLIDSPGVRHFEPAMLEQKQIEAGFLEFQPYIGHCRFHDCLHMSEPGCAINQAVRSAAISPRRLLSYHQLIEAIV